MIKQDWEYYKTAELLWDDCKVDKITVEDSSGEFIPLERAYHGLTIAHRAWTKEHQEAIAFFKHLKNHKEVQKAPVFAGIPVCKICGKPSNNILATEPLSLLNDKEEA